MPRARVGDIELVYELLGPEDGTPLVAVMGFAAQLIAWPQGLLEQLTDRGFRVLVFDNRDVGESTWLRGVKAPSPRRAIARWLARLPVPAPYTLTDMAGDVAGLMDHVGWRDAHVFGVSMGGMIAQQLALDAPERLRTLTSMMSHTGHRLDAIGRPTATLKLLGPRPRTPDEAAVVFRQLFETLTGPAYDPDRPGLEAMGRLSFERGHNPAGVARQMAAILASPERTRALRQLRVPTRVIHGEADPLVRPAGGRRTAKAIPWARLEIIPGLGHSLPPGVWPRLAALIAEHTGVGRG